MNLITRLTRLLGAKPKAFLVDECSVGIEKCAKIVQSNNIEVDKFSNFNELLYALRADNSHYQVGMIHENGSKYPPQILSSFIKKINPNIQLIIYKNDSELQRQAESLSLT
jgi:hypothetical protein